MLCQNHAGAVTSFDLADLLMKVESSRWHSGCGINDGEGWKPRFLHQFQFIKQSKAVRDPTRAGIAAGNDLHAHRVRSSKTGGMLLQDALQVRFYAVVPSHLL